MSSKNLCVSAFLCLTLVYATDGRRELTESDLRRFLFHNYDKLVRPVKRMNDSIPVRVNLSPAGIRDVDPKDQQIKMDTFLYMRWEDQYLKWDPDYYGTDYLSLPATEVWRPDIAIYTAASDSSVLPEVKTNVVIFSNGTVVWVPYFTVKNRCWQMKDPKKGEIAKCEIKVGSWTYHVGLVEVQEYFTNPLSHAEGFENSNPKWKLESMTASSKAKKYQCCIDLYSVVKYDLRLKKLKD